MNFLKLVLNIIRKLINELFDQQEKKNTPQNNELFNPKPRVQAEQTPNIKCKVAPSLL